MLSALLVVAVATFALVPVAAQDDPARLFPADTLIYYGTNSVRASYEADKRTAMGQIMEEAEVRAFLHEPMAAAEGVLKTLISRAMEEGEMPEGLAFDIDEDVSLTMSGPDGKGPPLGQVFFGLTHLSMPDMSELDDSAEPEDYMPDIGLVIGVELLDDSHVDMVKALWASIPAEESQGQFAGVDYLTKIMPDSDIGASLAVVGNLALVSTSEASLADVLSLSQGSDDAGPSLADEVDYRSLLGAAGGLFPGGTSQIVRVGHLADRVRELIAIAVMQEGGDDARRTEELGKALTFFESLGFDGIRMMGTVSAIGPNGKILNTNVTSADLNAPGLMPKLLRTDGPLDLSSLEGIPSSAVGASANAGGQSLLALYDFAMDAVETFEPDMATMVKDHLAGLMGESSLRDDILANLHGETISFTVPGEGFPGTPNSFYRMEVRDGPALVTALGRLLDGVSGQVGFPASLQESDHEGTAFYELDLSATPIGAMMQPAFAIQDGQIVFSDSAQRLKSFLNGTIGGGSITEKPGFSTFLETLGRGGDITSASYSDNAAGFSVAYGQLVPMAQLFAGSMGDIPVNLTKLPRKDTIANHLDASFGGTYVTGDGQIVNRSIAEFRASDILPFALMAGLIYAGQELGMQAEPVAAQVDPVDQAQKDLRELKAGITVYKIAQGQYPESLADLVRPLDDFPNGAFSRGELPNDPWGSAYFYAMAMHPTKNRMMPKLWSAGPNGVDDGGEGDDIVQF